MKPSHPTTKHTVLKAKPADFFLRKQQSQPYRYTVHPTPKHNELHIVSFSTQQKAGTLHVTGKQLCLPPARVNRHHVLQAVLQINLMPLCSNLLLLQIAVRPNELKNIPTENIKRICYFSIQLNKTTDIAKMH